MDAFHDYDAIIFDCDGVLFDSNQMKVVAFRLSARKAGFDAEAIDSFSEWQSKNFGVSRYVAFDRLLTGEFGTVPPTATTNHLLHYYAQDVATGYLAAAETDGARELIDLLKSFPLYVVSASNEQEVRGVLRARKLATNFRAIYGSPATKVENLRRVLDDFHEGARVLFIGDASADADAASEVGVNFLFMSKHSLVFADMQERVLAGEFSQVESLRDLIPFVGPKLRLL